MKGDKFTMARSAARKARCLRARHAAKAIANDVWLQESLDKLMDGLAPEVRALVDADADFSEPDLSPDELYGDGTA